MEELVYRFSSPAVPAGPAAVLCGVPASGNLEILARPGREAETCGFVVRTSARGFGDTWQAVLGNFAAAHAAGGIDFSINDIGATPAVVSLRLSQALAEYRGEHR
ncbi:malonate decarboxylase acyl carrier protein [Thauera butanivorans]|uniref:malonate decarboxylase acyl carrier protein n=1 Tax=Thauera butanivorans TaxID=86174 RepID=UPI003AB42DFF